MAKKSKKINSISTNQMLPIPSKNNTYIARFRGLGLKLAKMLKIDLNIMFREESKKCYF